MSLTKEDFVQIEQILDRKLEEKLEQKLEQKLNQKLSKFATKDDIKAFATQDDLQNTEDRIIKKVIARIDASQEELARMIATSVVIPMNYNFQIIADRLQLSNQMIFEPNKEYNTKNQN